MNLGISTTPKAGLLFDGHAIDQSKMFHGIADKGEDSFERGHQQGFCDKHRSTIRPQ